MLLQHNEVDFFGEIAFVWLYECVVRRFQASLNGADFVFLKELLLSGGSTATNIPDYRMGLFIIGEAINKLLFILI